MGQPVGGAAGIGCLEVIKDPALLRFRIDDMASLDAVVSSTMSLWQNDLLRLENPGAALAYDPSPQCHLDILLDWVLRLRAEAGAAASKPAKR